MIHDIGVIACSASHRICTTPTVQDIGSTVAGQNIVQSIAGAINDSRTGQSESFQIGPERIGHRTFYGIDAFIGAFGNRIPGVIYDIRVVSRSAGRRIDARTSIENIVATIADERIVKCIAGAIDRRRAGQCQVFHIEAKDQDTELWMVSVPALACSTTVSPAPTT